MTAVTKALPPTISTTGKSDFFPCNKEHDMLLSVLPGLPAGEALEKASCILAAARDVGYGLADQTVGTGDFAYGPVFLIEMAKGIVDSVIGGIGENGKQDSNHALKNAPTLDDMTLTNLYALCTASEYAHKYWAEMQGHLLALGAPTAHKIVDHIKTAKAMAGFMRFTFKDQFEALDAEYERRALARAGLSEAKPWQDHHAIHG